MGKRKGLDFERKVAAEARKQGLYAVRIAASQGEFDVVIIDEANKVIELVQCKKGLSYTESMKVKEEEKLKHFNGTYTVVTRVEMDNYSY